ncbi:MAG: 3-deoxy-manno-octulosonate cytidylyltransferase synthetase [Bacteroidota bacterium]|nr:3-deoxy-manno-octulosonate cytidylyltransferase synthetase [Bacteroidota bacterium]
MKKVAIIPARLGSTRFPRKLLGMLGGHPVIQWTYKSAVNSGLFDEVYLAADSEEIGDAIRQIGGNVIISRKEHKTGTDRIAEAALQIDADIILNVQGDEPFISRKPLENLLRVFDSPDIEAASIIQQLTDRNQIEDPNFVKVVCDRNGFAMYFSRAVVPFNRDNIQGVKYFGHIGVYAFRKDALVNFASLPTTPIEDTEKIEPIRMLEFGMKIKMVETEYYGIEIDTPEDLEKANQYINKNTIKFY